VGRGGTLAIRIVLFVYALVHQAFTEPGDDSAPRERKAVYTKVLEAQHLAWIAGGSAETERVRDLVSRQSRCVRQLSPEIACPWHAQGSNADAGTAGCRSHGGGERRDLTCVREGKRELESERRGSIARCQHRHRDLERRVWRPCHDHGDAIRSS
jgi:hypothetical protein